MTWPGFEHQPLDPQLINAQATCPYPFYTRKVKFQRNFHSLHEIFTVCSAEGLMEYSGLCRKVQTYFEFKN